MVKTRRKEIKRIEDRIQRQITFTKRRQGLFKKAGDLCKKCDAEIAVMAISAAGNLYAYGSPTFDSVIERYKAFKSQEESETMNADEDEDKAGEEDISLELALASVTEATEQRRTDQENKNSEKGLVLNDDPNQENYRKVENMALWDIPVEEKDNGEEDIGLYLGLASVTEAKEQGRTDQENENSEKGLVLKDDPNQENYRKVKNTALWDIPVEDQDNGEEDIGLYLGLASVTEAKEQRRTDQEIKNSEKSLGLKDGKDRENFRKVETKALWDNIPVDELKLDELEEFLARMEEMKKRVVDKIQEQGSKVNRR